MKYSIEYRITAAELRDAYINQKKTKHAREQVYVCYLLEDMVKGYCTYSDAVIAELKRAKPERFLKSFSTISLKTHFKDKYRHAKDPRLSFLKSVPDDHVFTFTMYKY